MKKYEITIKLSTGDDVQVRVDARNQSDALGRLQMRSEFVDFVGDAEILSIDIKPIDIKPIDNKRFAITTIDNKEGWYIAVDLDNRIKVEFKAHDYNRTNHVVKFGGAPDALSNATAIRELSDWLLSNFPELI